MKEKGKSKDQKGQKRTKRDKKGQKKTEKDRKGYKGTRADLGLGGLRDDKKGSIRTIFKAVQGGLNRAKGVRTLPCRRFCGPPGGWRWSWRSSERRPYVRAESSGHVTPRERWGGGIGKRREGRGKREGRGGRRGRGERGEMVGIS